MSRVAEALDDFAGAGGWDVALERLGIRGLGVEIMQAARATREANGLETIYADVWDGLLGWHETPEARLYIASPPCQTFSTAGKGAGRRALDTVLTHLREGTWRHAEALHDVGAQTDPRTALVLTPMARIWQEDPELVVLEQVPTVLPVWEAMVEVLREEGYSAWAGILRAEQYGVPQTRRRAILIARRDGRDATPPPPTHSEYHSRKPDLIDPGLRRWVTMADALGLEPGERSLLSTYSSHGDYSRRGERPDTAPAPTVTSHVDRNMWRFAGAGATAQHTSGQRPRTLEEPAHTVTGRDTAAWVRERPAPTIVGTRRSSEGMLVGRQLGDDSRRDQGGKAGTVGLGPEHLEAVRVTLEEAAALQTFPPGFVFVGTREQRALQIGNAVPPLLAEAILRHVLTAKRR